MLDLDEVFEISLLLNLEALYRRPCDVLRCWIAGAAAGASQSSEDDERKVKDI